MELIDEDGDLFGVVNVVDALVVLLIFAVAVAGATLVLGDDTGPADGATNESNSNASVRYATLDLGNQPDHIVDGLEEGDEMNLDGPSNLTITDVHAMPVAGANGGSDTRLVVRAELVGEQTDDGFAFAGNRLRLGQGLTVDTANYSVKGSVTALDRETATLSIDRTPILVETKLDAATAEEIRVGDEHRLKGDAIATVTNVSTYPVGKNSRRVFVGLELATVESGDRPTFGGRRVELGSNVEFRTNSYDLAGTIVRRGSSSEPGVRTTTTATITLEGVSSDLAESLTEGMTETQRNETLATISDVDVQPAGVVLRSDDGNIYLRDHPTQKDVTLTIELATRRTDSTLRFHGRPMQEGDTVTLDLSNRTIEGEITTLE